MALAQQLPATAQDLGALARRLRGPGGRCSVRRVDRRQAVLDGGRRDRCDRLGRRDRVTRRTGAVGGAARIRRRTGRSGRSRRRRPGSSWVSWCGSWSCVGRLPDDVGDVLDRRNGRVLEVRRRRERDVRCGDAHDRSVEIPERLVRDDRRDLGTPPAKPRVLLDRVRTGSSWSPTAGCNWCRAGRASARR